MASTKQGTYHDIIIILDESGSMNDMGDEPSQSVNNFVEEQQKSVETEGSTLSLWTFNSTVQQILDDVPLGKVKKFTKYSPSGMTALNDALGEAIINKLSKSKNQNVICMVITDGRENASQIHSRSTVRKMIAKCEKESNWKFIFIGANQDVFLEGEELGIARKRCALYNSGTPGALAQLSKNVSASVTQYRTVNLTNTNSPVDLEIGGPRVALGDDESEGFPEGFLPPLVPRRTPTIASLPSLVRVQTSNTHSPTQRDFLKRT